MSGDVMRELPLRHTRYARQSGKSELTAIICKERSDIVGKIKLKSGYFLRKVNTESVNNSQKVIMCLLGSRTLANSIKMEVVVIWHIGTINAVLSPFYKYSYVFHIIMIFIFFFQDRQNEVLISRFLLLPHALRDCLW